MNHLDSVRVWFDPIQEFYLDLTILMCAQIINLYEWSTLSEYMPILPLKNFYCILYNSKSFQVHNNDCGKYRIKYMISTISTIEVEAIHFEENRIKLRTTGNHINGTGLFQLKLWNQIGTQQSNKSTLSNLNVRSKESTYQDLNAMFQLKYKITNKVIKYFIFMVCIFRKY